MPIRFRCKHCHQLMGIARRKSGTEVQCPTCREMVQVPNEDELPAPAVASAGKEEAPAKANPHPVFERSDFDEVLRGEEEEKPARPARAVPAARPERNLAAAAGRVPNYDVEPHAMSPALSQPIAAAPNGIFVSSTRLTIVAVVGIILLAVAFGAGLLVGRYCL
jgi:phage FluMu protein Com